MLYDFSLRKNFDGMLKQYNCKQRFQELFDIPYEIVENNIEG